MSAARTPLLGGGVGVKGVGFGLPGGQALFMALKQFSHVQSVISVPPHPHSCSLNLREQSVQSLSSFFISCIFSSCRLAARPVCLTLGQGVTRLHRLQCVPHHLERLRHLWGVPHHLERLLLGPGFDDHGKICASSNRVLNSCGRGLKSVVTARASRNHVGS